MTAVAMSKMLVQRLSAQCTTVPALYRRQTAACIQHQPRRRMARMAAGKKRLRLRRLRRRRCLRPQANGCTCSHSSGSDLPPPLSQSPVVQPRLPVSQAPASRRSGRSRCCTTASARCACARWRCCGGATAAAAPSTLSTSPPPTTTQRCTAASASSARWSGSTPCCATAPW